MSGFGLDPSNGRVTADILAWEEYLKGKPEFGKWRTKLCPRYDDLEAIFGNDSATGDRAVMTTSPPFMVCKISIDDVEDVCDDDLESSDDEVNPTHVDVPEDETPNAQISFIAHEAWSSNRNTIADLMWADYHPNQNATVDFD
ncbi:unnamed protein product [Fraxinus pennsylvanica]|uniref:Uncharacterized protein n=1 Tax=Fraxinus pennsylvanica TaxID=56036 RepID=A0AAD2DN47_9LAMI|nr:unnamed protein product [Fraxinus pennsylvanica]